MRKIRDVLRLTAAGMSSRKVAASLTIGATTVVDCLARARAAGVAWPLPDDLSDDGLEALLFPASAVVAEMRARRPRPDWAAIHRELKRPGVTLQLVWEEHRVAARWRSAPAPTHPSTPSSATTWIANGPPLPRTGRR